jgi:hypothetical protein
MENYHIRFTNGSASRSIVSLQPNIDLAILAGHRLSAAAFNLPWNQAADRAKWKIIVISNVGERHEEQARVNVPFREDAVANILSLPKV